MVLLRRNILNIKNEIKRKLIHLLSLIYVFGYWYFPKYIVVYVLIITIIVVAIGEYMRFKVPNFNIFFKNNFKGFYRTTEINKISGLIWTLLGALFTILIFHNKSIVFVSFLYFTFGDAAAALAGKFYGKHKIYLITNKTFEGSLACFITCFISGLTIFNYKFAIIGAIIAMVIEAIPWEPNDNFWIQTINAWLLTSLSNIMLWTK
ncbi:MAG: hypothetical protein LBQ07_01895 [Endomicrobium sp.]|jgi:dolichol kinase|nr:hypothetical protein [Endomicrobium sp.]